MNTYSRRAATSMLSLAAGFFLACACATEVKPGAQPSADWPCWRGPNHDGIAPASPKLLDAWPKEGPKLVWKTGPLPAPWTGGGGCGGPVVADGKVFVNACWRRPVGGGDKYRPFTAQIMREWGYIAEMPEELAKKIEEARLKTPKFDHGYNLLGFWMPEKKQDEGAAVILKNNPDLDKYTKDFLATLDPKDAEKYGSYVKRRFCHGLTGSGGPLTWEQARKGNAVLLDKETPSFGGEVTPEQGKLPFAVFGISGWNAWDRASQTTDTMVCLDAATGKELWKKEFPAHNWTDDGLGGNIGPASNPTVWGGKFYAVGAGGLYCLSAKDGTLLWQVKGGGAHSSVLVADGVVVYGAAGTAYDAETGKELWKGGYCGNSSPVPWTCGGKTHVISGGTCLELKTGKEIWKIKGYEIGYGLTPVVSGDFLIGIGCAYKTAPDKAELLWKGCKGVYFDTASSPIVYQDHLYQFASFYGGDGWHCFDVKTGQEKWRQPNPKDSIAGNKTCSSSILADGKIIHPIGNCTDAGYQIEMVEATPEKFIQLGVFNPGAATFSSPAMVNGRLYLRLKDGVACYDLTGTK